MSARITFDRVKHSACNPMIPLAAVSFLNGPPFRDYANHLARCSLCTTGFLFPLVCTKDIIFGV